LGAYYVVKTYSVCVLSRILQVAQIVRQFNRLIQNTARCVLSLPPLRASASVRIYIPIKSCKLTPDDNIQDLAPDVSMGDIRARRHRYKPTYLM
jgi:hypothetical protein